MQYPPPAAPSRERPRYRAGEGQQPYHQTTTPPPQYQPAPYQAPYQATPFTAPYQYMQSPMPVSAPSGVPPSMGSAPVATAGVQRVPMGAPPPPPPPPPPQSNYVQYRGSQTIPAASTSSGSGSLQGGGAAPVNYIPPVQPFYGTVAPLADAFAGNLMSSIKQALPQQIIQHTVLQNPFGNALNAAAAASARQMDTSAEEEEEGPLLEELGIVPRDILRRMLCVLTFKRVGDDLVGSMDMTGPVLILLGLGCALLMSGKVHFEYVYALMTGGTLGIWALLNLIAKHKLLSIHRTISVLGYGLLPILIASIVMPFIDRRSIRIYLALTGVLWSTATASRFMEEALDLQQQRFLAAYPILLFYVGFIMITAL